MLLSLLLAIPAIPVRTVCPPSVGPALLVDVSGFKSRVGRVRVRVFGGATSTYFDRKHALVRQEVPIPATAHATFCIPVPRPGAYAVDVRHDVNLNGKTDRSDGGGVSGNPRLGLLDVVLGRKPDPRRVQVQVGTGVATVPVTVMYLQGSSFKPWGSPG